MNGLLVGSLLFIIIVVLVYFLWLSKSTPAVQCCRPLCQRRRRCGCPVPQSCEEFASYEATPPQFNILKPYVTEQDTNEDGEFETDFVYQNEGGANPTDDVLNAARRRFPFDWANLPPSSSLFQAQQALFVKDPTATAAPFVKETFDAIEASKVLPPDIDMQDELEAEILSAYKAPECGGKVADQKSVEEMIQTLYGKQGFIPRVAKQAGDVYAITDLIPKHPKIIYEDEVQQASIQSNELNPLADPSMAILRPGSVTEADLDVNLPPQLAGERTTPGRQPLPNYSPTLQQTLGPKMMMQNYSSP